MTGCRRLLRSLCKCWKGQEEPKHVPIHVLIAFDDMRAALNVLEHAPLPHGCGELLVELEDVLERLNTALLRARALERNSAGCGPTPWTRPLPHELADWEQLCTTGGALLHTQVCVAAEGEQSEEWLIGRLFICESGVMFEGGMELNTGLVRWDDIERISVPDDEDGLSSEVGLVRRGFTADDTLRLQLSNQRDVDWLVQTWSRCTGTEATAISCGSEPGGTFVDDDGYQFCWLPLSEQPMLNCPSGNSGSRGDAERAAPATADIVAKEKLLAASANSLNMSRQASQQSAPKRPSRLSQRRLRPSQRSSSFESPNKFSDAVEALASYNGVKSMASNASFLGVCAQLSAPDTPMGHEPLYQEQFPTATLAGVRGMLERPTDWPIDRIALETVGARVLKSTKWVEAKRAPGTFVKRSRMVVPLPRPPGPVAALVNFPPETIVTAIYRLQTSADEVVLVQQSCSPDVPFGENFCIHDTLRFRQHEQGGVEMSKWSKAVWVKPLPWTHGVLRRFVEGKILSECLEQKGKTLSIFEEEEARERKDAEAARAASTAPLAVSVAEAKLDLVNGLRKVSKRVEAGLMDLDQAQMMASADEILAAENLLPDVVCEPQYEVVQI